MTSTITRFEARLAPCGRREPGERSVNEDGQGLVFENVTYDCGCRSTKEEFHDGSVYHTVIDHRGKVLVDEELRGE
ncbi:MAG TPA: hypothetical protein VLB29_13315 [Nocardioidaceae bacterium]|nr:hypothetical protein [Nocardioidaceae bacterium]